MLCKLCTKTAALTFYLTPSAHSLCSFCSMSFPSLALEAWNRIADRKMSIMAFGELLLVAVSSALPFGLFSFCTVFPLLF